MYAFGSVSQPLHLRIQPGWPPPDALPARGTASTNLPFGYCGYSSITLRAVEALLVAQLDAAQVEHAVLHRGQHLLAAAGRLALVERRDDAERQMQPRAASRRSARR